MMIREVQGVSALDGKTQRYVWRPQQGPALDCFNCGTRMVLEREYAKGHYAYFCPNCGAWRYYP